MNFSQNIEIGDDAKIVKKLIEYSVSEQNKSNPLKNIYKPYWTTKTIYNNGKISEIELYKQNQVINNFGIKTNYREKCIVENDTIKYIIKEFEALSLNNLQALYIQNLQIIEIDNYYFSEDLNYNYKFLLSKDNISSVELRLIQDIQLPKNVNDQLTKLRFNKEKFIPKNKPIVQEIPINIPIVSCYPFIDSIALVGVEAKYTDLNNHPDARIVYGFIDLKGNCFIKPQYFKAFPFMQNFALVQGLQGVLLKWYFIDKSGTNTFNKIFDSANSFSEGCAAVRENGKWGFIDTKGEYIIKPQYEAVENFIDGLAAVKYKGKWGFIDKNGKEIIYPQFSYVSNFKEGICLVGIFIDYHNTKYKYIDKNGNTLIQLDKGITPDIETVNSDFNNGLAKIIDNRRIAFIDKSGRIVFKAKNYKSSTCHNFKVFPFANEYAIAESCGKIGYLNKEGNWIVKPTFDEAGNFSEGFARVKKNGNWGFIDKSGNVVINKSIINDKTELITEPPYEFVSDFSEGIAIVKIRNLYGYINTKGQWLIKPSFLKALPFQNNIAPVIIDSTKGWQFIDRTGKPLFDKIIMVGNMHQK